MREYEKPKSDFILSEACDILTASRGVETPLIDEEEEMSNGLLG